MCSIHSAGMPVLIDHESRSIAGRLERKTNHGVDTGLPGRRMGSAKTPGLHDPLARYKLDLAALHPTTEKRERIAFAIGDLGRLPSCSAEVVIERSTPARRVWASRQHGALDLETAVLVKRFSQVHHHVVRKKQVSQWM
jgi:hypothetical protein